VPSSSSAESLHHEAEKHEAEKHEADARFLGGLLLIAGAGFIFSVTTFLSAIAGRDIGSFEIIFISGTVRWMVLAIMVWRSGESPIPQTHQRAVILLRCICGFVGFSSATFAFTKMPIGDASAIVFSAPVWASLFSRIFLKEPFGYIDTAAVAVGLTGVLLVSRPSAIFGHGENDLIDASSDVSDFERIIAPFVAILGSIGAGSAVVCIRLLGMQGGLKPVVLAHAYGFATMAWAPLGFLFPGQAPHFDLFASGTWIAVGIGVLSSGYQVMLNTGMMRVPASIGSMMRNTDIVASYSWQVLLLGQSASVLGILGSVLIVGATVAQAVRKLKTQRLASAEIAMNACSASASFSSVSVDHVPLPEVDSMETANGCQANQHSTSGTFSRSLSSARGTLAIEIMMPSKFRQYQELAEEGEGAEF